MQFRLDGQTVAKFPNFIWKHETKFLLRLEALELRRESVSVLPHYRQLFEVSRHGGQCVLDVFVGETVLRLTLQKRFPFVDLAAYKAGIRYVETADDED